LSIESEKNPPIIKNSCITYVISVEKRNEPAVIIDFIQVFWSILGHITYLAFGLSCLNVNIDNTKLIPVAMGTTKQLLAD